MTEPEVPPLPKFPIPYVDYSISLSFPRNKYYLQVTKKYGEGFKLDVGYMRKSFDSITQAQMYFNHHAFGGSKSFNIKPELSEKERLEQTGFTPISIDGEDEECPYAKQGYYFAVKYISERQIFEPSYNIPSFDEDPCLVYFMRDIEDITNNDDFYNYCEKRKMKCEQAKQLKIAEETPKTYFVKQEKYKKFLEVSRINSEVITYEARFGDKPKFGTAFRLQNCKFLLSYNGVIIDKDFILEKFKIGDRPGNFFERIREMYVCHEITPKNVYTHVMFVLKPRIDTKNVKHFDMICSFEETDMQNFTPLIFIQSEPQQAKTKIVFNEMDPHVFKYVNPKPVQVDNSQSSSSSAPSIIGNIDDDLSHSTSSSLQSNSSLKYKLGAPQIALQHKSDISTSSSKKSMSLESDSDDEESEFIPDMKECKLDKEYANLLCKEIMTNTHSNIGNKTLFIFPSTDNSILDYTDLRSIGSYLNSIELQRDYNLILAQHDEEDLFNELIECINEKKWNKKTLLVYLNSDNENEAEDINLYNKMIKFVKHLRLGLITTNKYRKSFNIGTEIRIVIFFPVYLDKTKINLYPGVEYRKIIGEQCIQY